MDASAALGPAGAAILLPALADGGGDAPASAVAAAFSASAAHPSAASETARVLAAAILDQHSVWWALASPLFALSVAPYLLFLRAMYAAPSATDEQRASFATLLLFVIVSIPAEAYTQEAYGTVLSNIDALHFLIQAAISLTNLRIVLAFRNPEFDDPRNELERRVLGSIGGGGWIGGEDSEAEAVGDSDVREAVGVGSSFRPGALVEAAAGLALVSTFGLMALDARLVSASDLLPGFPESWRVAAESGVSAFRTVAKGGSEALAFGQPPGPPNALSVPTWGVHVFSLVEWLVAMGLVWDRAGRTSNAGWRKLTWGMLPLHASGVCACAQHFFNNAADLEWLVAAQGALTMAGNVGMWRAAEAIKREDETNVRIALEAQFASEYRDERKAGRRGSTPEPGGWVDFDVESFAPMWREDDDATFAAKIAALSLGVATAVRATSLWAAPAFAGEDEAAIRGRTAVAAAMVLVPFALNVAKWGKRQAGADEDAEREVRDGGARGIGGVGGVEGKGAEGAEGAEGVS